MKRTIRTINGHKFIIPPDPQIAAKKALEKYRFYNPKRPPFKEKDLTNLITPKKIRPYINIEFNKLQIGMHLSVRGQDITIEIVEQIDTNNYLAFDRLMNQYIVNEKNAYLYRHISYNKPPKRMFIDCKITDKDDENIPFCLCYPPLPVKKEPNRKIKNQNKIYKLQIELELIELDLDLTKYNAKRILLQSKIKQIKAELNKLQS